MKEKYEETLDVIIQKIIQERQSSIEFVNFKLVSLYWEIGNILISKKEEKQLEKETIKKLSEDLSKKIS